MNLEVVHWLIPGYFCLLIYNGTQGIKHQGTWDFLIKLAPASAVCALTARLVTYRYNLDANYKLASHGLDPDLMGTGEVAALIALLMAIPIGLLSPVVVHRFFYVVEWIRVKVSGSKSGDSPNLFSLKCKDLLGKMVQVSAKNGKVYGAYLVGYSFDDKVPGIKIAPFISGYRKKELTVEWNTLYLAEGERIEKMKHRELLIPAGEISSLAELDFDFHMEMLKRGTSTWNAIKSAARKSDPENKNIPP